jgi:hypothetical protein
VKRFIVSLLVAAFALALLLAVWPYRLVASPNVVLHVVDEGGRPLIGMRVVRQWDTSEGQKGEDETTTDAKGSVSFKRIEFRMSWLKRITKPLVIFVPASCGLGWEVYGHALFNIYWPRGYALRFDDRTWKKADATYENREGIHIYDPSLASNKDYIGLYVFNKRADFEYTITLYRAR